MNRPNRVAEPATLAGYTAAPPFAWSGWRLRIPGGPVGGQYHGFIGPDSAGWPNGQDEMFRADGDHSQLGDQEMSSEPWSVLWGGTVLREGQDLSDHVYRSPAEMRPRPNASGGAHVVHAFQRRRSAGFAEAPGNYRALGAARPAVVRAAMVNPGFAPVSHAVPASGFEPVACPSWGCGAPPRNIFPGVVQSGATSTVAQPGPPTSPAPINTIASTLPSNSPQPSPTVAAPTTPTVGQPLPSPGAPWTPNTSYPMGMTVTDSNGNLQQVIVPGMSGPGPTAPVWASVVGTNTVDGGVTWEETAAGAGSTSASWFSQSTVIAGVPNLWIALGAGAALFFMMKGKK